jgi:thiol-disulfide isomerase/thioredoxin
MNPRALRLTGGLLVMLFGVWLGLRVYSSSHAPKRAAVPVHSGGAPAAGVPVPAGEASPPTAGDFDTPFDLGVGTALAPGGQILPKIPEQLPEFSLGDRTGKPTSIATWRGKSLIINFWATWCAPCRHEIPLLQSIRREWRDRNVEVVGIAVDYRDKVAAPTSGVRWWRYLWGSSISPRPISSYRWCKASTRTGCNCRKRGAPSPKGCGPCAPIDKASRRNTG